VRLVTRVAFDAVHRPRGFELVDTDSDTTRWIVFLASDLMGGGRVRSEWPAAALKDRGWRTYTTMGWPGGGFEPGDVLIIHRPKFADLIECVQGYQAAGLRVLIDDDDELERIPRRNRVHLTKAELRRHRRAVELADGLIVTTERLEQVYGPLAQRVWRCPNYIPAWVSALEPDLPPGDKISVGWAGTLTTHRQDVEWIAPAAKDMVRDAVFVTVGDTDVPKMLGLRGGFVADGLQQDPVRFYRKMARADIGIVPLDNGRDRLFNTSKSDLKVKEFLALGRPVVATDLPAQRAVLEGTGAGFLVQTPQEMADAVQTLVHDRALLADMTAAAVALRGRLTLEAHIDEWAKPLKEVSWLSSPR
jgi:glycosyltransferase involved in cell wall biosynthesis